MDIGNNRIAVFAIEKTRKTSQKDIDDFLVLMNAIEDKYNFRWCRTMNPNWVRALADEQEQAQKDSINY